MQLPGQVQQKLQCFERLQTAEDARHRTQHSRLGAVADNAVARGFGPDAAQTGTATVGPHHLQLAFILINAGEKHRISVGHGQVVQQELGCEIVGAVDDEVGISQQCLTRTRVESVHLRGYANVRIQRAEPRSGELRLRLAAICEGVQRLAMQVGRLQAIAIDDGQPADACAGKILQHRHTEPAGTDHCDMARAQPRLTADADLGQQHLPRVVRGC